MNQPGARVTASEPNRPLHLFAVITAVAALGLIFVGGLVTSTGSGLSVPDWPNTYGRFMFTFPLSDMVGGIWYEHSHRLLASAVGLLTLILAYWLWRTDNRPWVRRVGLLSVVAVVTQGLLGGLTVLYLLPTPVSVAQPRRSCYWLSHWPMPPHGNSTNSLPPVLFRTRSPGFAYGL